MYVLQGSCRLRCKPKTDIYHFLRPEINNTLYVPSLGMSNVRATVSLRALAPGYASVLYFLASARFPDFVNKYQLKK